MLHGCGIKMIVIIIINKPGSNGRLKELGLNTLKERCHRPIHKIMRKESR
jgi:hypothetical protein